MIITLTENAVKHLQSLLSEPGEGRSLRLFVEKGGCAGWQYGMTMADAEPGDEVVEQDGVRVYVEGASVDFLRGSTIDHSDDLASSGFKIRNPNAARSCGCGTSFETAEHPR